jgi:hypothetical protein
MLARRDRDRAHEAQDRARMAAVVAELGIDVR